jgi:hypothetical protein
MLISDFSFSTSSNPRAEPSSETTGLFLLLTKPQLTKRRLPLRIQDVTPLDIPTVTVTLPFTRPMAPPRQRLHQPK